MMGESRIDTGDGIMKTDYHNLYIIFDQNCGDMGYGLYGLFSLGRDMDFCYFWTDTAFEMHALNYCLYRIFKENV